MGQAKQKRLAACRCGSGKPAITCCLKATAWHKAPAALKLHSLSAGNALSKCYMHSLKSCGGKISGEHLISEKIMKVLKGDGDFRIGGVPWLPPGQTRIVGIKSLTANCLCERHNSSLTDLDTAAANFVAALLNLTGGQSSSATVPTLFSGHDIERWLLKTLKALAVSGNLASNNVRLPGDFATDVDVIKLLDNIATWPLGAGLYFSMAPGARIVNQPRFRIQPFYGSTRQELVGLWTSFIGLEFVMMIAEPDMSRSQQLRNWLYRPSGIEVVFGSSIKKIDLSWDDGIEHSRLKMEFERSL